MNRTRSDRVILPASIMQKRFKILAVTFLSTLACILVSPGAAQPETTMGGTSMGSTGMNPAPSKMSPTGMGSSTKMGATGMGATKMGGAATGTGMGNTGMDDGAANPSPEAGRRVAAEVQSFYERTTTIQCSFHQTYFHKLYNRYERSQGQVLFKKPGKMRWNYARPNGKVISSDGTQIRVFEPGEGSEPGQMFEQQIGENSLPLAFSFLTGTGRLDRDFTFRLLDSERQGFPQGSVLELRPRRPTPHYDRVLFYVGRGQTRGVIHRVLIVDSAGNRNRFDFRQMRFNRPIPGGRFNFTPPENTRIVQP